MKDRQIEDKQMENRQVKRFLNSCSRLSVIYSTLADMCGELSDIESNEENK